MNRTISLYALVISYKKVPVEIRKLFSFSKDEIGIFLAKLKEIQGVEGAVVLSTCNRTEVYFSYDDSRRHISEIICDVEVLFSSFKDLAVTVLRKWVLSYMGIGAVKHLFHVTSGLDSAVLGENEIVAQVKEAYGITVENEFADFVINTVFQKGLACSKEVKSCDEFKCSGLSYATLITSEIVHFQPECKKVFILGASGVIGSQLIKNLCGYDNIEIITAVRKHRCLCEKNIVEVAYADRYTWVDWADVVVSVTTSPHYVLTQNETRACITQQKQRLFIDVAVPNDIDPLVQELDNIELKNIDYFNEIIVNHKERRISGIAKAEEIISSAMEDVLKTVIFRNFIQKCEDSIFWHYSGNKEVMRLIYDFKDNSSAEELEKMVGVLEKIAAGTRNVTS